MISVEKVSEHAQLPKRATPGSAGYDLCAVEHVVIAPGKRALIKTGIKIEGMPQTMYGRIAPRSGLAFKYGIDVMAGVIDSDYRGEIGVILYNSGDQQFEVKVGDRIAQMIFEQISYVYISEGKIGDTERGAGGFGSTG